MVRFYFNTLNYHILTLFRMDLLSDKIHNNSFFHVYMKSSTVKTDTSSSLK